MFLLGMSCENRSNKLREDQEQNLEAGKNLSKESKTCTDQQGQAVPCPENQPPAEK